MKYCGKLWVTQVSENVHYECVKNNVIPPLNKTVTKQRSVSNDDKYGPGSRPHWTLDVTGSQT